MMMDSISIRARGLHGHATQVPGQAPDGGPVNASHIYRRIITLGFSMLAAATLVAPAAAQGRKEATKTREPIAVQDHEVGGVQVALLEVKRQRDTTITVRWEYRNTTDQKQKLEHGYSVGTDPYRFARKETYLVDTGADTKYTVLQDSEENPVAAKHTKFAFGISLAPKQNVTTWAKFGGVPADLQQVTVYVPGAPPFEDVTIAAAAPR
jgi:hypothetical protein